ncbi:MAG: LysR substrate-binding domain-containing protein [Magnetovibrio sp.]|nr:LysR substrate-binding domain-containing protein [Magnetovibrio sp.]
MNLRDFAYAVAVDEHRHFGRAAEACHVSQPTLSGQIRKLEAHLGVELFERTKRAVRPTPAGARILERARTLLAEAGAIEAMAAAMTDPLSGPLNLGAIPTIAPYLMPRLLPSLAHALPSVELRLTERFTGEIEAMLVDGGLDAAIIATEPEAPQLASVPLYDEPFWVALPKGHALAQEEEVDLGGLAGDRLLLLSEGHCLREQVLGFYASGRGAPAEVRTEETSLTTILALVGGGLGVTLVPAMSLSGPWVTDAGIVVRRETSGAARRRVQLAYRKSFPRMALVEKLADVIAAIVPDTVAPYRR